MTGVGAHPGPVDPGRLPVVPANQVPWSDPWAISGRADRPSHCLCQRYKVTGWLWRDTTLEERVAMAIDGAACGDPESPSTSGLVAYIDDERCARATAAGDWPTSRGRPRSPRSTPKHPDEVYVTDLVVDDQIGDTNRG